MKGIEVQHTNLGTDRLTGKVRCPCTHHKIVQKEPSYSATHSGSQHHIQTNCDTHVLAALIPRKELLVCTESDSRWAQSKSEPFREKENLLLQPGIEQGAVV